MAVPIYVIHWQAPEWCRRATDTLLQSDTPVDVTVVDNSGGLALDDRVRIIPTRANVGYAGGANIGITEWLRGVAPFCLVGSHDLHVEPNTVGTLVAFAEKHPDVGIVAPLVTPSVNGDVTGEQDGAQFRTWVSGTCLLLNRKCIEDIGPFDERFGSYTEDRDLGLRATDAGWRVAIVTTVYAQGLGSSVTNVDVRAYANQMLLAYKRGGARGFASRHVVMAKLAAIQLVRILLPTNRTRREHARSFAAAVHGVARAWRRLPAFFEG